MAEQQAIDDILNWISYGKSKPVGIGDWSGKTGFRGVSPRAPIQKIKRHGIRCGYKLVSVKENYTSKMSSCCRGHAMKPSKGKDADGNEVEIHGLRVCTHCGKTWNRDFNAAINIFDIFYNSMVKGQNRPPHLTRNFELPPGQETTGTWWASWEWVKSLRVDDASTPENRCTTNTSVVVASIYILSLVNLFSSLA